ncbi:MAG TPA: stage II sporulation protein P [Bacillota bacterium]|nr:stage II sporulation protein P [Bacillota bacterium]
MNSNKPLTKPSAKNPPAFWISYGSIGVILMLLGAFSVILFQRTRPVIPAMAVSHIQGGLIRLDTQSSRFILKSGIPTLERNTGEDDPFRLFHFNWTEIYWKLAANVRTATPYELMKAQFPALALSRPRLTPKLQLPVEIAQPPISMTETSEIDAPAKSLTGDPLILLYHTHTTESYIPESGKDHANPDKQERGDIVKVGEYMRKVLEEKYGIKTIHDDTIHDSYPFRESYVRSQATIKKYLEKYPSIQVVFDIHRDATPGVTATCTIKGQTMSTILMVVGTDKMGLAHPHWKENHQFAKDLSEAINRYYPGLNSGIIVSDARYNQHLHKRALILEFGDQNSTLEEVYRAVDSFVPILVAYLNDAGLIQ